MKITLRKANAIQIAINDAIRNIETNVTANINEFQDGEVTIAKSKEALFNNINCKLALLEALHHIRWQVGKANVESGINSKLTEVARLEKFIQLYTTLGAGKIREEEAVLAGKLEKLRSTKDAAHSFYRQDEVVTSILEQEDIDMFRLNAASYKKTKQRLQDEILESNIRTEINLNEETVQVLTREGIL
jgi:hypothetical protein